VHVTTAPALYVASEESALAHWVGAGDPRPTSGPRPFQRGVDGRPTLVQNVETLAHLALVARHGGDWFAAKGAPSAPGTTLVTVGGAVASPGVVEVPTGTAVADILASRGGLTSTPRGWLTGGYGGAWVRTDGFLQTRWDPDSLREVGGVIGASVLWVMGDDVCPLSEAARVVRWMAGQSAGQCGPCMFGLPAVADDLHRLAGLTMTAGDLTRLEGRLGMVRNRGACKHPDGVSRFAATALDVFDDEVRLHLSGRCSSTHATAIRSHHLPVPRDHGVPVPASVGVAR
jgi:NADH:ubiquinone oxidoreductase subunit F (NADH-binding)